MVTYFEPISIDKKQNMGKKKKHVRNILIAALKTENNSVH